MSNLKVANVQKCLEILKDFHKAVKVESGDEDLKMKKAMAGEALKHLEDLFAPKAGEFSPLGGCTDCGINIQSSTK